MTGYFGAKFNLAEYLVFVESRDLIILGAGLIAAGLIFIMVGRDRGTNQLYRRRIGQLKNIGSYKSQRTASKVYRSIGFRLPIYSCVMIFFGLILIVFGFLY